MAQGYSLDGHMFKNTALQSARLLPNTEILFESYMNLFVVCCVADHVLSLMLYKKDTILNLSHS